MPQEEPQSDPIDIRLYIGMLFFRWKVIVVCFLYALLGGVLYINLTTPKYEATSGISIFRDPLTTVTKTGAQWSSSGKHAQMLSSGDLRDRVVNQLFETWGEQIAGNLSVGVIFGLISFLVVLGGVPLVIVAVATGSVALIVTAVALIILLLVGISLVSSTLSGIYTAAVYRYATTGDTNGYFDADMVQSAFKHK